MRRNLLVAMLALGLLVVGARVVIAGTARVTCGDRVFELAVGQSTGIPFETRHRLENPGSDTLHIIEVQNGPYLGEDDIVRFQDDYGRGVNTPRSPKV